MAPAPSSTARASTAKPEEISRFSGLARQWWDENGPMRPLHRLNPVRLDYIAREMRKHFKQSDVKNLRVLDVGCAAGLVSEGMAKLGCAVTGIDASDKLIEAAREHAKAGHLKIDYRNTELAALLAEGETFDCVLALEVIEHVNNAEEFARQVAGAVRPGGMAIFSTLNRTAKSFALGIVGAEYIMRWLPIGTHNWKSFIKPSELAAFTQSAGLITQDITGLNYNPITDHFSLNAADVAVNYLLTAIKGQ